MKKKIDFRQMKYWLPAAAYPFLLMLGYLVVDTFNIEVGEKVDHSLVSKNELNADLPSAQVGDDIGDKLSYMRNEFGRIKEETAVSNVERDKDSIGIKLEYQSSLKPEELAAIREKQRADSLEALLRKQGRGSSGVSGRDQSAEEFTASRSSRDREKIGRLRRRGLNVEQLERDLGISLDSAGIDNLLRFLPDDGEEDLAVDTAVRAPVVRNRSIRKKAVEDLAEDAADNSVVKRITETSSHFNTISANADESNMIKAIIDENVKVVDGSRVRLRLLDDVYIDQVLVRKGSYLYAEMSGFSKQRIKGKVGSMMVGDQLLKCNLNVYDLDGLEGLYIPQSSFRETAKDVGSSAFSGGSLNVSSSLNATTNVAQFASQALQNAYQRTSQAVSKAIKKNRVRLKYGTQVYLINSGRKASSPGGGAAPQQEAAVSPALPGSGRLTFPPRR